MNKKLLLCEHTVHSQSAPSPQIIYTAWPNNCLYIPIVAILILDLKHLALISYSKLKLGLYLIIYLEYIYTSMEINKLLWRFNATKQQV